MSNKKQIFKINTLKKLLKEKNSCLSVVPTTRLLALPPFFLNDMKSGVLYLLNNMLKKYDRSLGGIVIGYQNVKVLMDENTGIIPMGTSETEVNISIEFYIFQPKIGSFLEGVVNKKSNSHIGCLVHRYFNATILKPEDVDYDEWICKDFNVDDKIIFKVKDLDFTTLLPLIEGVIDDGSLCDNVKNNSNESCDLSSDTVKSVNKVYPKEVSFTEEFSEEERGKKNDNLKGHVNGNSLEFFANTDSKIKKKRTKEDKEKKELINFSIGCNQTEKEEGSRGKGFRSDTLSTEFNVSENHCLEKKKKKDKKKQKDENVKITQGGTNEVKHFARCLFSNEAEDNVFCSTQLEADSDRMLKICCSPISKSMLPEEERQKQNEVNEKKRKQKYEKRKKEEEPKGFPEPKKMKSSHSSFSEKESTKNQMNSNEYLSTVQTTAMEEVCLIKQVDENKKEFNKSDKGSSREQKKKKERINHKEKEVLNLSKIKKARVNEKSETEKTSELHSLMDELRKQEIQRVKEELNISSRESSTDLKKTKLKLKKKEKETLKDEADENFSGVKKSGKTPSNDTGEGKKNFSVQNIMDQLLKQELNRVKEEYKITEDKSINKLEETSPEETHSSLYEKLMQEAKSAMVSEECKLSSFPPARESRKRGEKNVSNSKSSFETGEFVEKPSLKLKKTKATSATIEKYKNGSMYDAAAFTPEKVNFEKSLFSDSEQSHNSPFKKGMEVNKIEVESVEQSSLRKKTEGVKNESRQKSERGSDKSEHEKESLYEKLLRQAKSSIQNRNECSPRKKKEKHSVSKKNKKSECKTS